MRVSCAIGCILLWGLPVHGQSGPRFRVEFAEPRAEIAEVNLPVDPAVHAQIMVAGSNWGLRIDGKQLCFGGASIRSAVRIDGRTTPNLPAQYVPVPHKEGTKSYATAYTLKSNHGPINIMSTLQVVPTKPVQPEPGQKRRLDAVLATYEIENTDTQAHSVGLRVSMDAYCWNTDGPLIISGADPERVLNGVELKGKTLPAHVRCLSNGATAKTGFAAHFALKIGNRFEGPDRFVHTRHVPPAIDDWNFAAVPSNGDSDYILYFDPREIPAKGKRVLAFGYGEGISGNPANEGRVTLSLRGSFEPKRLFNIEAFVEEPIEGQSLSLELPDGMERLEGKEVQPVPASDTGLSLVLWKARVLRPGAFTMHVRSNSGAVYSRTVTVSKID